MDAVCMDAACMDGACMNGGWNVMTMRNGSKQKIYKTKQAKKYLT